MAAGEGLHLSSEELSGMEIPNPSQKVYEVTGVYGVAEVRHARAADAENGWLRNRRAS